MLWMLGGYMWLYIHRPFEVWEQLGAMRLERVYMIAMLAAWIMSSGKSWIPNRLNRAFLAMVTVVLLAWLQSPFGESGTKPVEDYLKVAVFYVVVVSTVRDEQGLRRLSLLYLVAVALYMTHSLFEYRNGRAVYRMGITRMVGVDTTFNDPNTFAATIIYSLPMVYPFWKEATRRKEKLLVLGYVGLSVLCIALTGSRTAFVALGLLMAVPALLSKYRLRFALLLLIGIPVGWGFLPPELQNRFTTLIDPSVGPANAQASAESRGQGWRDGVQIWKTYPLLGAGPGGFGKARGFDLESHQLYGQVIGELGTAGALALLWIVAAFLLNARDGRRLGKYHPELRTAFSYRLMQTVLAVLAMLLFMGFGGHNLYRYTWMWFGAFQIIALHCLQRHAEQLEWEASTYAHADEEESVEFENDLHLVPLVL